MRVGRESYCVEASGGEHRSSHRDSGLASATDIARAGPKLRSCVGGDESMPQLRRLFDAITLAARAVAKIRLLAIDWFQV